MTHKLQSACFTKMTKSLQFYDKAWNQALNERHHNFPTVETCSMSEILDKGK